MIRLCLYLFMFQVFSNVPVNVYVLHLVVVL